MNHQGHEVSRRLYLPGFALEKERARRWLPETNFSSRFLTSSAGMARRMASMAASACSDSLRTWSSRNSIAVSWRVRAMAGGRTEQKQGSESSAKRSRQAFKHCGE